MNAGVTAVSAAERECIRALASRWAEIADLPVMAERKRAWTALRGDCNVELLFRDVHDIGADRSRLKTWVGLARSVYDT